MMKLFYGVGFFLLTMLLMATSAGEQGMNRYIFTGRAQGTTYHITYYAEEEAVLQRRFDSLLRVIDKSMSLYRPDSEITKWNKSKRGGKIDSHFRKVVEASIDTYKHTDGFFDITVLPLINAWGFGPVKSVAQPDSATIREILGTVGTDLISLRKSRLRKKKPFVQIDVNGIAQGYTVDLMAELLEKANVHNYLVELGGEIRISGRKFPSGEKMSIGIEAPSDDPLQPIMQKMVYLEGGGITTSGNYRNYRDLPSKRVSHLLDPHTGFPIENELISVTVCAANAMTADALDNALMGMGLSNALQYVNVDPTLEAFFIFTGKDGTIADTMSAGFKRLLHP